MDVASLSQSISVIIAAWTAVWAINAWRREFIGKKRIELAEDVLARFYEARDVIRLIRSPFGQVGEGATRQRAENERPEEAQILDNAYVVFERYNRNQEVFNQLRALRYRFIAQFGPEAAQPFDGLFGALQEIFIASRMLTHYWKVQGRRVWNGDADFQRHLEQMHAQEAIFWEMAANDPTNQKVERALGRVEEICRQHIQEPRQGLHPLVALRRWRAARRGDAHED